MSEQGTSHPQTGMDRFFGAIRGIGIRRRTDDKWIAGVCSGLADRLGVDPIIVRAGFILLTLLGGAGITVYLVAWALLPNDRDEIPAQRALRDGDGGSIVLIVFASLALFGGSMFGGPWWSSDSDWGFPWGLVLTGLLIWWLVKRSGSNPEADDRVRSQQLGSPVAPGPSQSMTAPASPAASGGQAARAGGGQSMPARPVLPPGPAAPANPVVYKKLRRRSGGPRMALLAIGLAITTYGALIWAGSAFSWAGDQEAIAIAGASAATGLLLVVLGLAGWRAGFVAFLALALAVTAWTTAAIPSGIHFGGRVGDALWEPTSVTAGANDHDYRLGVGDGVLDLTGLPTEGLSTAAVPPTVPAYVGMGELKVLVPEGLTVKVVAHVGLGEILLPSDARDSGQGGSDITRSTVVGDGPTELVVNAGVGLGQLTVVKE